MTAINQAVFDFMDKRLGIYVNPYNVEFILDEEDAISVSCDWPEAPADEVFYIELEFDSDTIEEFTNAFGITLIRHIGTVTPDLLIELYLKGKANIFIAIDDPPIFYSLHFRKLHNKISVKRADDVEEAINEKLVTPKEFMAYTFQHFQLAGKS